MKVFLAGIIQGGLAGDNLHDQDYRTAISDIIESVYPSAVIVEPHRENPDRLDWPRERQSAMFLDYVAEAAACDVLIAWLPGPSMGTAVEMYAAFQAGVPIVAITPLTQNWTIFTLAWRCLPDLKAFADFVLSDGLLTVTANNRAAQAHEIGAVSCPNS